MKPELGESPRKNTPQWRTWTPSPLMHFERVRGKRQRRLVNERENISGSRPDKTQQNSIPLATTESTDVECSNKQLGQPLRSLASLGSVRRCGEPQKWSRRRWERGEVRSWGTSAFTHMADLRVDFFFFCGAALERHIMQ